MGPISFTISNRKITEFFCIFREMFHSTSGISESALGKISLVEQQVNIHKSDAQIKNYRKKEKV